MLENIKLMLGLTDSSHDELIILYISKVESVVLAYTSLNALNDVLNSFVEDKVVSIVKAKVLSGQNTGEIASVSRGDTTIQYNVSQANSDTSKGAILSESDKKYLNSFKPTSWRLI